MKQYFVYILASNKNGTLYIGVTNNMERRISEHKGVGSSVFTKKYAVNKVVYFEDTISMQEPLARETQLKKWNREWKLRLIESSNPNWLDLSRSPPARG